MFELQNRDRELLKSKGISEQKFYGQLKLLKQGVPFIRLVRPCTKQSGIVSLDENELQKYITLYDKSLNIINPVKFVPSSGAASRMFSLLVKIVQNFDEFNAKLDSNSQEIEVASFKNFITQITDFAFAGELKQAVAGDDLSLEELINNKNYDLILKYLLSKEGLDYINRPKGLIVFHKYNGEVRTAFEEHLVEATNYSITTDGKARVHFTILKEHEDKFNEFAKSFISKYEKDGIRLEISFSFQRPDTEIVAAGFDDNPLRDKDGNLIFRPGGHGALLQNLGELDGEIIFVKNIDNVVPDRLKDETTRYKKALGGYLLDLKNNADRYLKLIGEDSITDSQIEDALKFIEQILEINIVSNIASMSTELKKEFIFNTLNRPFRVCGVVKNEGQPGGGPFWVRDSDGNISKQIVESAQVDTKNEKQNQIWNSSSHFNPVDLVCAIYDYKGNKFDLQKFVDMDTVFITKKSKDGIDIKAMEHPGLWNGAMAHWNTIFVEVPLITFNPVKTVFDLLKPEHLSD